ncbi:hypothetical protein PMAYCL1PPCAC_20120 [Pristionchus mayeri]|uniref:BZIP domain-containing protein n=1 Tax=Pristionchus mayeri TaxID=1317129 RepID=A0AAN5CSV4_9BILA|nr:hypothetical protein PMAYCL1PPCAC_20120 [Pristionchus mayeri]
MTRATVMLLNSFRIACRQGIRSPGVTNGSCASLGSLAHLPAASPFPHSSVVEHLLKTPPLFPSPAWSPSSTEAFSPHVSPFPFLATKSVSSTPASSPQTPWKSEKEADEERSILDILHSVTPCANEDTEVEQPATEEVLALPDFHAFIDEIVTSVKKEIKAENRKKKRCVRRESKQREEEEKTSPVIPIDEEKKEEDEDGFMICCGRRAKPIDISARKRKMPLKIGNVATPTKKKVMDAEEMATRIRSQNRAAAKKYRQMLKVKRKEMEEETDLLEEEQARLLKHVEQLTAEVEEYKQRLLGMTLQSPLPQSDNG